MDVLIDTNDPTNKLPPWGFRGRCVRVVDGDTYDILCDCGFSIYHRIRVRLRGVNTPEIFGAKACEEGKVSAKFVEDCILDKEVYILTFKKAPSTYNRWEADVFFKDQFGITINLAEIITLNGHGVYVEGYGPGPREG
jgi:endonuclease YncB( thermonuclease family)